jgi:4'-phosphopantetheinyl transferase
MEEKIRADRFQKAEDRKLFQASHIFLRYVLSLYTGDNPSKLRLKTAPYGKPELAVEHSELRFNLTHSHRSAACAITEGAEIGVDMEAIDPSRFDHPTAEQVLGAAEMANLRQLVPSEQLTAFFLAWTRKEACAKCEGLGLSMDVRAIELGLTPGPLQYCGTTIVTNETPNHCLLTLAVKRSAPSVEYWQLPPGSFL